jgi:plastocyanin
MQVRSSLVLLTVTALGCGLRAESVTGTILIKKRLTRPNVTAPVSVYQRGAAVKLGRDSDPDEDPVAYERSRVVIYLEGPNLTPAASAAAPNSPLPDTAGSGPAGPNPAHSASSTPAPIAGFEVAQRDRRFVPDLVVVPVGSSVSFPNMDPIFHNIFSLSKAKSFDLGSYDKGETRRVEFPRAGIVEVYCHLHPNMEATVVVTPNRWYARADRAGQYQISNVPPGSYTVVAWHRSAGFFRKQITVEAGHDGAADFFIPIEDTK